jgi:hypothetical protein
VRILLGRVCFFDGQVLIDPQADYFDGPKLAPEKLNRKVKMLKLFLLQDRVFGTIIVGDDRQGP